MNGTLPARDRGYRGGDPRWQSGSAGFVPGTLGLVCGVENPTRRGTPPGFLPAARIGRGGRESGLDRVSPLTVFDLGRSYSQAQLLADGARQKAAHTMRLPASRLHQFGEGCALGSSQQIEHLLRLAAIAGSTRLFSGLGRFLRGAGLLGRLPLLRRNVRARCADTSPFRGFRLLGRLSGSGFFNSCIHVISFRGNRRGEDINHSGAPKMQVNSGGIANESHR